MNIRRSFFSVIVFALYVQLLVVGHCDAQIVFDNTTELSSATSFGPGCCLSGTEVSIDELTTLSEIEWLLDGQSLGVSDAEIQMAIHANDGPDGAPSTQLWDQTFSNLVIAPEQNLQSFAIPNIQVGQNFTVTARVLSSTPIATGFAISSSTDIGTVVNQWMLSVDGDWGTTSFSQRAFRITGAPVILGDINRDGVVDFFDIAPFIAILTSGDFQVEADFDKNEVISFGDINPFIKALQAG